MNYPPDAMTDAMVCNVASQQQADGSWHGVMTLLTNVRAPMQDGDISVTAKDILSLRKFGFPGRKADFDERIERARRARQYGRLTGQHLHSLPLTDQRGATALLLAALFRIIKNHGYTGREL